MLQKNSWRVKRQFEIEKYSEGLFEISFLWKNQMSKKRSIDESSSVDEAAKALEIVKSFDALTTAKAKRDGFL